MKFRPFILIISFIAYLCTIWVVPEVFAQTEGKIITAVEIRGNKRVDKHTILFYIKSKKGEKHLLSKINADIKAIYDIGQFDDIRVEALNFKNGIKLIYIVKEIPSVRNISFVGNKKIDKRTLKMKIAFEGLKKGSLYSKNRAKKTEKQLMQLYKEKGYFLATIRTIAKKVNDNQVDLLIKISENKKVEIKKIIINGNKTYTDRELKKQLKTKEKGFFSFITDSGIYQKEMIRADMLMLEMFYREHGFINVKVLEPTIDINRKEKAIFIKILIEEGEQYRTGKIEFDGDDTFPEKELKDILDLKEGDIYSLSKIQKGIFNITELYSEQGYAYADARPKRNINTQEKTVDIVIQIDKSKKVYIGNITITGNHKTKDKVVRREFRFNEGGLFDSIKLKRSKERIINTGFFEDVQIQTSRGEKDDTIDLNTSVVERTTGSLSFGIGYSSIDKAIISAEIAQDNLFGNGQRISFMTQLSSRRTDFSLSFTEPWLFDREISAGMELFHLQTDYTTFESKREGGGFSFGKAFTEYTWGNIAYRFENVELSEVENETAWRKNGTRITSRIIPKYSRNTIDNRLNPTKGTREIIRAQYAGGMLGGLDFYKLSAEKRYYYPLFLGLVGMFNAEIAYARGYNGDTLPIYERYFMGGSSDLRGFTFEDVGPKDVSGNPLGGEESLLFNLEIQYPFNNTVRAIIFYDRGNVYGSGDNTSLTSRHFSLSNMRHSVGAGIQFYTPMGPMGLAYGYKLDKAEGEDRVEMHFIIGRGF